MLVSMESGGTLFGAIDAVTHRFSSKIWTRTVAWFDFQWPESSCFLFSRLKILSKKIVTWIVSCIWFLLSTTYFISIIMVLFLGAGARNSSKACNFSGWYIYSEDELNPSFHSQLNSGVFQQTNSIVIQIKISIQLYVYSYIFSTLVILSSRYVLSTWNKFSSIAVKHGFVFLIWSRFWFKRMVCGGRVEEGNAYSSPFTLGWMWIYNLWFLIIIWA